MKKLRIYVNGKQYEVDVEIIHDDEGMMPGMAPQAYPYPMPATQPMYPQQPMYQQPAYQPAPMPAPMPAPAPAPAPAPVAAPKPKAASANAGENELSSPINGVVLEIPVAVGQAVNEGQVVVVLEAMKMKTNVSAHKSGTIGTINIKVNDNVESGQALLTIE